MRVFIQNPIQFSEAFPCEREKSDGTIQYDHETIKMSLINGLIDELRSDSNIPRVLYVIYREIPNGTTDGDFCIFKLKSFSVINGEEHFYYEYAGIDED